MNRAPAALALALLLPAQADADGFLVWNREDTDIHEPEQKALIVFADGVEDLVLEVKFEGAPEDFGWIVPLPSVPEITPEDDALFEALSRAMWTRPRARSERGRRLHLTRGTASPSPEVVEESHVGVYDTAVLRGGTGASLEDWLRSHDYRVPARRELLDKYAERGWVFAAMRIAPESTDSTGTRLASGTIQPLRFRFSCDAPIFPLEISAIQDGESTVLLYVFAPEVLVPVATPGVGWDTLAFADPGGRTEKVLMSRKYIESPYSPHPRPGPPGPEPTFLIERGAQLRAAKHRAVIRSEDMRDVTFDVYDAEPHLESDDEAERAEAATYLGTRKPEGAVDLLLGHVAQEPAGAGRWAMFWALGQLGDHRAVPALLPFLDAPDPDTRIEAAEALSKLGAKEALPRLVPALSSCGVREAVSPDWIALATWQRAAFDYVVSHGDASCVPALRQLAEETGGFQQWLDANASSDRRRSPHSLRFGVEPGILSVAALAALGDERASTTLVDAVVVGGKAASDSALRRCADRKVSYQGHFPGGFWPMLLITVTASTHGDWPSLRSVSSLLEPRPDARDGVLAQAASDSRTVPAARAVLLALLDHPSDEELATLREIWSQAVASPRVMRFLDPSSHRYWPINVEATLAACALARHRRSEDLEALEASVPPDDPVLAASLGFARSWSEKGSVYPAFEDYFRDVESIVSAPR